MDKFMINTLIEIIGSEGDNSYWNGYCYRAEFNFLKKIEEEMKSSGYAPSFKVYNLDEEAKEATEKQKKLKEYEKKQIEKACGLDAPTKSAMQIAFEKAAANKEG